MKKFDVVVGNPPFNEKSNSEFHSTKTRGSKNLWIIFFETSKALLKDTSYICFITPNHWIRHTNKVKNSMLQGHFLWAEISEIKKHFSKVGSTFTAWIWSPTSGISSIFCKGQEVDIHQNLVPCIAEPTLDDWQFLNKDFGRKPVKWKRAAKTDNMKMPCIVMEQASPMKRIYAWDGIEIPRGEWYFYNCSSQDELNDIIDFLRSSDGQRIIKLIRSGTAMTHIINRMPCSK